jgi:hypothetical protein
MGKDDGESTAPQQPWQDWRKHPLNCPYCGQTLVSVPSDGPTAYYQCGKDGLLMLPPDGRLRKATVI